MKKNIIYNFLLMLCFLGIFGSVQAGVDVKIDFARVQDISGEKPNKTAACIVVWVDGNDDGKVFCRYELNKNREFWRDNTDVNHILYSKTGRLLTATSQKSLQQNIKKWLMNIGFSQKSDFHSQVTQLFNAFTKTGIKNYKSYSGYKKGLFKKTKPYDLVLLKKLDNSTTLSYETFAFLAHYEVHRVVSAEPSLFEKMLEKHGDSLLAVLKNPDTERLLRNDAIVKLLTNQEIQQILSNPKMVSFLSQLEPKSSYDEILFNMLILLCVIGVLLLVMILWTSGNSQNRMNDIVQLNKIETDKSLQEIKLIAHNVSQQTTGIKRDILTIIRNENDKVEKERQDLKQQVANSEHSQKETERELTNTNQVLAKTTEELVDVKKREERMHKSLESLMLRRFRVIKPAEISIDDLLAQLTKQGGTWQWYQQVLSSQYEACANAMKEIQVLKNPKCDKITKLLNVDNILFHWHEFIAENPYFESDDKLLGRMFAINGGTWLSNVFRADDLLKTYFADILELKPLATRLAITAMMLQAALEELSVVKVIKPELLEKPSGNLPPSAYKSTSNPLLMELTHKEVMSKLSDKEPQLVVDIEKYGFVTPKNPEPSMTILLADLNGWEFY